jgi:hypothetical protein
MILNFTIANKVEYEARIDSSIKELLSNKGKDKDKDKISFDNQIKNNLSKKNKTVFKIPFNVI